MRFKRLASIAALLLVLVLSACAASNRPAPGSMHPQPYGSAVREGSALVPRVRAPQAREQDLASMQEAEQYIYECLLAEQTEIDLSAYKVPVESITALFTDVMNRHPDLFFVQSGISYSYTAAGHIVTLTPSYYMTGEQLAKARAYCAQRLDEICAGVDENWSDFEIALYLHDYLCLHFSYDTTYQIYDMYTFLAEGRGVCQAYTLTYTALLARFGIHSDVAASMEMNHIWNVVTLGGRAFHVDVTWDDPMPDQSGQALHQNFLRSDAGIAGTGHYAWVSDQACTSDAYESTFTPSVAAPFVYTAGQWFCADGEQRAIFAVDFTTMSTQRVLESDHKWLTPDGGSYYLDAFWGVGTYRGNLIYNTPNALLAHNLQSGVTVEIDADLPRGMQIFGLWVDGDTVYYTVSDTPDGSMQVLACSIADLADYIPGDADQNGTVDGRDVTAMLRYLANLPTVCHTGAADLDDSGSVDARDVQLLRRYIVENN